MAEIHVCIGCGKRDTSSRSMVCIECQRNRNENAQRGRDSWDYEALSDSGDKKKTLHGPEPEDEMEIDND